MFEKYQDVWISLNNELLVSDFSILATINIKKIPVQSPQFNADLGEPLDPLRPDVYDYNLPDGLKEKYLIRGLLIEYFGQRLDFFKRMSFSAAGRFDPFDAWFLCKLDSVRINAGTTIFDYVDFVELKGDKFKVKGNFVSDFDSDVHLFLNKTQ